MVVLCGLFWRLVCGFMLDQAGQLGESGEYQMGRLRVVCFYIRSSEAGSPRLWWLITDHLAPVNKIELCTDAYVIYRDPANVVASTVAELDNTPLYFTDDIGTVWGPPTDAWWGIAWKTCTRIWWARLDSLIVIVNCGHSYCLHGSCVSCCQVISLAWWLLIRISTIPSDMSDACSLLSFRRSAISPCSYEIYGYA
jgi:hypothetical protein